MKPKPAHYDAYEGKWFYTEEQVDALIALMRGQSDMVMVPRDVVDSIEHCVSKDLRPYFETIVLWAEKIKASSEGHSR